MRKSEISKVLKSHNLWATTQKGTSSELYDVKLHNVYFENLNLRDIIFQKVDFESAGFVNCNLENSRFINCKINNSNFGLSTFTKSVIQESNFNYSRFFEANMQHVFFNDLCNFYSCNFSSVNFQGVSFKNVSLKNSNLSGAKGLLNPSDWLQKTFEFNSEGIIVYKAFGNTIYLPRTDWIIKRGQIIEEEVNYDRTVDCGCGINFATKKWVSSFYPCNDIWKCLISYKDMANICVPYNTDGKARCGRLKLLYKVREY